jgi:hypothetical protein
MTTISPNPLALAGNKRTVEHLDTQTGSERNKVMIFHYEACTFVSAEENAAEIVQFRKTDKLTATNETKVDAQGNYLQPDENGVYPEGAIGEWDFYVALMFSGAFTQAQIIKMVILRADENNRFN